MLIGIDGGGTKTALCAAQEDGRVIGMHTGEGTNPADIGLAACEDRLRAQLDALLTPFGGRGAIITGVYAGIAGSANALTTRAVGEILRRLLPCAKTADNGSDAFNALYGEAPSGEGIALIAGTGSSSFALAGGRAHQVGGWGYLIDDAGSGYRIGADALKAAYRAMDGRGRATALMDACETRLGLPLSEGIPRIYEGGKRYVASFAPVAFDAARAGDEVAADIVRDAARALAAHVGACLRFVQSRPAVCVASGGLMKNDAFFDALISALGDSAKDVRMVRPTIAPVYGALVKAAVNAGFSIAAELRKSFIAYDAQGRV